MPRRYSIFFQYHRDNNRQNTKQSKKFKMVSKLKRMAHNKKKLNVKIGTKIIENEKLDEFRVLWGKVKEIPGKGNNAMI